MKKNQILKIIINLIVYPIISLGIVYGLLKLMDQNVSRASFVSLMVIALALPGLTLAYGIYKLNAKNRILMSVIASAISALVWVAIAYFMHSTGLFDPLTLTSAFWLWLTYWPFIFSLLVIFEMVALTYRLVYKRKKA